MRRKSPYARRDAYCLTATWELSGKTTASIPFDPLFQYDRVTKRPVLLPASTKEWVENGRNA